jgi:hypothetical protein
MHVFISHISALSFWRCGNAYHRTGHTTLARKTRVRSIGPVGSRKTALKSLRGAREDLQQPHTGPAGSTAFPGTESTDGAARLEEALRMILEDKQPLHILVPSKSTWRHAKGIYCHLCTAPLPSGSFRLIGKGIFVCSPEFVFLQMASSLSFPEVIELGMELCGSFSLSQAAADGAFGHEPITNTAKITSFLSRMSGARNTAIASRALAWVIDNSRSPMESITAMLLTLPPRYGGYGLRRPLLNPPIFIPPHVTGNPHGSPRQCDLFWPEKKVAVEYDSNAWHTGTTRIAQDSTRRNELAFMDISVISITWIQISDIRSFDRTARIIAKKIGFRIGSADAECLNRRLKLHASLVFRYRRELPTQASTTERMAMSNSEHEKALRDAGEYLIFGQ